MFNIPLEHTTRIKADEEFVISAIGHGEASLCGQKVFYKVPSAGLFLGQRFRATRTNKLVPVTFPAGKEPKHVNINNPFFKKKKKG